MVSHPNICCCDRCCCHRRCWCYDGTSRQTLWWRAVCIFQKIGSGSGEGQRPSIHDGCPQLQTRAMGVPSMKLRVKEASSPLPLPRPPPPRCCLWCLLMLTKTPMMLMLWRTKLMPKTFLPARSQRQLFGCHASPEHPRPSLLDLHWYAHHWVDRTSRKPGSLSLSGSLWVLLWFFQRPCSPENEVSWYRLGSVQAVSIGSAMFPSWGSGRYCNAHPLQWCTRYSICACGNSTIRKPRLWRELMSRMIARPTLSSALVRPRPELSMSQLQP